ncbi:hypothetical protein DFJ74DRAFT_465174 [Hyaloraphidium curvatum]|nr:hypothetical protein DFJ74DRAFT_465174 [Hyaloraphidium curvatum]
MSDTTVGNPRALVFPFHLRTEPIERLLVASFNGDPEFEMLEPQVFDDAELGRGLRVLAYRKDGKVDVYTQPGLRFDAEGFDVGAGLGQHAEVPMDPARFEISDEGVDVDIAFTDVKGRRVELCIREAPGENLRFPFLAPVGADVADPKKLFLVDMQEFDFVRSAGTIFRARVGDCELVPASFPIPRNWNWVYFVRYASKLLIGQVCPPETRPVVGLWEPTSKEIEAGPMRLAIDAHGSVEHARVATPSGDLRLSFSPAFPNLAGLDLAPGGSLEGSWDYISAGSVLTGGRYAVRCDGKAALVTLDVTQPWSPVGLPFAFRLFTFAVSSFRMWPTTYRWEAKVDLESLALDGRWQRKGR